MFSGPTAEEWADRNRAAGDAADSRWLECAHWDCERHVRDGLAGGFHRPVYGVGCVVRYWEAYCAEHEDAENEDVFYCEDCGHEHETHTSWELHYVSLEEGELTCLQCAAERALREESFWITDLDDVTTGWLRTRPHMSTNLVDGLGPFPEPGTHDGYAGMTLDGSNGEEIYGFDRTYGGGLERTELRARQLLEPAIREYGKAGMILSRAYQFAVFLEVVVPARVEVSR